MNAEELKQDLRRIADEIRVNLHLAGMDAKQAWSELEPRLHLFEQKFERVTDRVADEISSAGATLRRELERMRERVTGTRRDG